MFTKSRVGTRRATLALVVVAAACDVAAYVSNSTGLDHLLRRRLPGLMPATTVVPLATASLLAGEMPRQVAFGELILAGWLVRRAGHTRTAIAVFLAVGLSWLGLARADSQARQAVPVLDAALRDALGSGYMAQLPAEVARETTISIRQRWAPRLSERPRYLRHENLAYGEAGIRNHLDIWYRSDLPAEGRAPVLVQIHGSAWVAGNKRGQGYPLMAHMAERGWVCVAINYSLAPRARWPAHIIDVKRALGWVKREIHRYGGDPDFIALTGGSAGGHLTALAALTPNQPLFQPGFEDEDTSVAAAVPFYGVYDWTDDAADAPREQEGFLARIVIGRSRAEVPEVWKQGSPVFWVNADAPPFFVLHGALDTLTPPEQAERFAAQLRRVSRQPVAYAELPGAQHMFDCLPSTRAAATVAAVDRFLTFIHDRTTSSP